MSMSKRSPSIAVHYHQRTKYSPDTIAKKHKSLNWDSQPPPFKEYKIGTTYDLQPDRCESASETSPNCLAWRRLSHLLGGSYGLTAQISRAPHPQYLRAAPSAGGLYPAELYLISKGTPILPPGLYHYQPQTHSLIQFWSDDRWESLQESCFNHPALATSQMALVVTAMFERSAWRYEDRAYRRICLDIGHLLGNIDLNASINNYRAHAIGGFLDAQMYELLYLDPDIEGAMAIVALADLDDPKQHLAKGVTAIASDIYTEYPPLRDGELLSYFHQATEISDPDPPMPKKRAKVGKDKYNFPFCLKIPTASPPIDWGKSLSGLEQTVLRRRSTRAYSGANLTLDELKAVLDFTYQPQHYRSQGLNPEPDYFVLDEIETFIAVSGVEGLEEGCYYYAPQTQELRQIRFKNFRSELHFLCLGQDLGRDAAALVFQTAELTQAIDRYGDRVYRYLHLDAGQLGQRLNLAAIHLGLGASGIGGFFDDRVNEVLGIPESEAVLYITTLGRPR